MKLIRGLCALTLSFLASTLAFAEGSLNPGWYFGVLGGAGTMGSLTFPASTLQVAPGFLFNLSSGNAKFGLLGDVGMQLGYRYCDFRFEGEFLFGGGNFRRFTLDGTSSGLGLTILPGTYHFNKTYPFDTLIPGIAFWEMKYRRLFIAGFFNVIYDFYPYNREVSIVPYIGAGIGAMTFRDQFIMNITTIAPTTNTVELKTHFSGTMGQAIIGVAYLLDDFSNLGFDFRYMVSNPVTKSKNSSLSNSLSNNLRIYTLNLVFNYTFDDG